MSGKMLKKILQKLGGIGYYEPIRAQGKWRSKLRAMEAQKRVCLNFEISMWGIGASSWLLLGMGSLAMLWKSLLLNLEANGEGMREYGA